MSWRKFWTEPVDDKGDGDDGYILFSSVSGDVKSRSIKYKYQNIENPSSASPPSPTPGACQNAKPAVMFTDT